MHAHSVLMLAAVGVVWLFVPIVIVVGWLQRRGYLGPAERRLSFGSYAPTLLAAASAGAAAVHVSVIVDHAARSAANPNAVAFLCSIGAANVHFTSVGASAAGLLPIGMASLALTPVQGVFAFPRVWRDRRFTTAGIAISLAAMAVSVVQAACGQSGGAVEGASLDLRMVADPSLFATVFELAVLGIAVVALTSRPGRLVRRLEVRVADAWIGTGLAIATIAVFAGVAIAFGHIGH